MVILRVDGIADLNLRVGPDGTILISRGPALSSLDWSRAQAVFGNAAIDVAGLEQISIDAVAFEWKAVWLRDWERDNRTIAWDDSVPGVLEEIRRTAESFKTLMSADPSRHRGQVAAVPALIRELKPEQHENVLCLLDMPNGCNFSVPGAGKTLTSLATWRILKSQGKVDRLLVVCPRSAMEAWTNELSESFADAPQAHIFGADKIDSRAEVGLVNYEQLENPLKLERARKWLKLGSGHLVIDEAHRIKGGGPSVRWRACQTLGLASVRVDVLTGTPMPNSPEDLKSLFAITWPRLQEGSIGVSDYQKLRRKTVFVRTTKDELGLPPVELKVIVGEATPLHRQVLDALADNYRGLFDLSISESKHLSNRGKAVMTMLAAATNPGLLISREFSDIEFGFSWPPRELAEQGPLSAAISGYLNFETPWKYRQVVDLAGQLQAKGKKIIVWSSFIGNLAALKRYLAKFQPAVIYGAVSAAERATELARFREDPSCGVLLTNPQTLGEGISLHTTCNDAIYVDRTFNAGHYLQSVDRIHRLGLPKSTTTTIYFLQTDGSIDRRAATRLDIKIRALGSFLNDASLTESAIPTAEEIPAEEALGLDEQDFAEIANYTSMQ